MDYRVTATGHLLRDDTLERMLHQIVELGGSYEVTSFQPGRLSTDESTIELVVAVPSDTEQALLDTLVNLGAEVTRHGTEHRDATLQPSDMDGTAPDGFYSTTNHPTLVKVAGRYLEVKNQRMDCVIVVRDSRAECVKMRDVKVGDQVVLGHEGIRVLAPLQRTTEREFCFMSGQVSSERNVARIIDELVDTLRDIRAGSGRLVVVAGPAVVHTGASPHLSRLIRHGFVGGLLAGNALAAHDIEQAMYGTSLGVEVDTGRQVQFGNTHHLRAINAVRRAGSIAAAVERGIITSGIFYECVMGSVPFVLAGSIRDDGPLPDTDMDLIRAQDAYAQVLRGATVVLVLATLLHAVGVCNMLPSSVKVLIVDINSATVLKLVDRGSEQVEGVITDVGLFLRQLTARLNLPAD